MPRTKDFDPADAVDAAMDLFWRKGYEATSVDDLVKHLGVGRGSLYATFGSKHQLYLRALDRYRTTRGADVVGLLGQGAPLRKALRVWLEGSIEATLGDPERRGCMMVNAAAERGGLDPAASRCVCANADAIERAVRDAIVRAQATGEVAPGKDARALARFFVVTSQGLAVAAKTTDRAILHDTLEVALATLD
jgi:TetR/AcrR family transcriptional repressor of nem operon